MAADFWSSSHYNRWMVDRASIKQARTVDLHYVDNNDPEHFDFLNIYFANAIMKLGRKLSFRQRVIATAIVFFKRFYLKNAYCETDPFLVIAACCYLAAKAEECPVSIKIVASESKALFSQEIYNIKSTNFDHTRIAEMEFYLVDDLESDLTIYHPYRTLTTLCKPDPSSSPSNTNTTTTGNNNTNPTLPDTEPEEGEAIEYPSPSSSANSLNSSLNYPIDEGPRYWGTGQGQLELPDGGFQHAWFIINDTYRSNICLVYPPHLIAVAAICLTVVFHPPSRSEIVPHLRSSSSVAKIGQPPDTILTFLASLNVSFPLVATIIQEIVSLWTLWDRYKEDATDTSSAIASASPGGGGINSGTPGRNSSLSPTKSHQSTHRSVRRSTTATTTLSTLSASTPKPTAVGGGDEPDCASDNSASTSSHSSPVEEPAILFTPAILSNVLVRMREARIAVEATLNNSGGGSSNVTADGSNTNNSGSGTTTPGMVGKAANKILERTQAAG